MNLAPRPSRKFQGVRGVLFWASIQSLFKTFLWTFLLAQSLLFAATSAIAQTTSLNRDTLQKLLPSGLLAGELDPLLAVRPVFERVDAKLVLRGYAFETVHFEPARGYSGKPINLLVTLASDGTFLGVHLISHHEPIFTDVRGTKLLADFAHQYEGLTFRHNTQIVGAREASQRNPNSANLKGIATGTVSARAIDRGIIQAAIQVARQRFDAEAQPKLLAPRQPIDERYQPMPWDALIEAQWIQALQLTHSEVEARFAGTPAADLDPAALLKPQDLAVSAWLGPLSSAQVGRNLLDDKGWAYIRSIVESGQYVWLAVERGQLSIGDSERLGRQPGVAAKARLQILLSQAGRSFELREIDFDHSVRLPAELATLNPPVKVRLFRTLDADALNPMAPIELSISTSRRYGADALQRVRIDWTLTYPQRVPLASSVSSLQSLSQIPDQKWWPAWKERWIEFAVLALALTTLTLALARPLTLSATAQRLRGFRIVYLLFTLGFIGWYAQAQLSIVNLTSAVEALRRGDSLDYLMFDPLTICLWGFSLLTLFVWGRGTFCGWLCPFGALQELLSLVARAIGIKGTRLTQQLDQRLKYFKYLVLLVVIASAGLLTPWTDQVVEVEPFKTSINMGFARAWPYVVWAVACAMSSVFIFRGYCRYICPLGAALAVLGMVRLTNWIPRRSECGKPCQTCRHRCEYQAIKPTGQVDYRECFQCLDCVTIYQDTRQCLPLVRMDRKPAKASDALSNIFK